MRMEGWAIHGSNQAMKQWARAWQRQQRNLTLILNVLATGLIGKAKKKKKSFVLASVHSEGSVGHGVSWVFCLLWSLGSHLGSRFPVSGLVHRILLLHADTHVRIRSLKKSMALHCKRRIFGAYAHGAGFGINTGRAWHCFPSTSCFVF